MDKHPIENIMTTTMENIRDMVDVNTVIGEPITTGDGSTVIPLSKVCFGFVAGGSEFQAKGSKDDHSSTQPKQDEMPFGGGTGAGVSVTPMGFLVMSEGGVRLLPAQYQDATDRVIELVPQVLSELKGYIKDCRHKKDQKNEKRASGEPMRMDPSSVDAVTRSAAKVAGNIQQNKQSPDDEL